MARALSILADNLSGINRSQRETYPGLYNRVTTLRELCVILLDFLFDLLDHTASLLLY
jgi:hypothetical protein